MMCELHRSERCPAAGWERASLWVISLSLLLLPVIVRASGVGIVDDRGVTVRFDAPPRRVITMMPSLTESVCALGACNRLVGTDRFSNQPVEVRALPKLGGLDDANVERIVSLRPDVVLLTQSMRITERLEVLGLKVVVLETHSYEDVKRVLARISELLQSGDATQLWQQIDAQTLAAARSAPAGSAGMSVCFEVDSTPFAAGDSSFIGQTLRRFGLRNIVPSELGPFPRLNPEFVVRANPRFIMAAQGSVAAMHDRPGWAGIDAVRRHGICPLSAEDGDVLTRPGPRMALGAEVVARCLRDLRAGTLP
jgi:iron complex transport system substrate-binding protein